MTVIIGELQHPDGMMQVHIALLPQQCINMARRGVHTFRYERKEDVPTGGEPYSEAFMKMPCSRSNAVATGVSTALLPGSEIVTANGFGMSARFGIERGILNGWRWLLNTPPM